MSLVSLLLSLFPASAPAGKRLSRQLYLGLVIGFTLSLSSTSFALFYQSQRKRRAGRRAALSAGAAVNGDKRPVEMRAEEVVGGVAGLIGNTPLVRINSLSDALGVEILGKAEYLNPGGSPKDRVALQIIEDAETRGLLHPHTGSCIFEGTVGSTGISIATIARAKGYECVIIMPDDVAMEKVHMLEALGAKVERVRPASIIDERQFVNLARSRALAFGQTVLTSLPDVVDMTANEDSTGPSTPATGEIGEELRPSANGSNIDLSEVYGTLDGRGRRRVVVVDANGGADRGETYGETNESVASVKREANLVVSDRASGLEGWKTGEAARGFFADQFENPANHAAHYTTTGPEIWRQLNGRLDAFVSGAGTGGTLSGVGKYLKEVSSAGGAAGDRSKPAAATGTIKVILSDPEGSGLYNKVKFGVMFDRKEREGTKRRHQVDTVVEGIGINRITHNFELGEGLIDEAFRVSDADAVAMSRHLVLSDGLFLGSSSACNLVACVRAVKAGLIPKGGTVVTILCDSGSRHYSKFWSDDYLRAHNIPIGSSIAHLLAGDDSGGSGGRSS